MAIDGAAAAMPDSVMTSELLTKTDVGDLEEGREGFTVSRQIFDR